jgi:hypothetical protein
MNDQPPFLFSVNANEASMGKSLLGLFGTSYALSVSATLDDQHQR